MAWRSAPRPRRVPQAVMSRILTAVALLAGSPWLALAAPPAAEETQSAAEKTQSAFKGEDFIRVSRTDKQTPKALETSIVQFAGTLDDGATVQVDLVAAVHLADEQYYTELNRRFGADYDSVLYELVAPEGTRIPKGGRGPSDNPLGATQQGMSDVLDLKFQLDEVDYTLAHFRHADLSPEEFTESMRERQESILKMVFRMMGHAIAKQTKDPAGTSDLRMLSSLFAADPSLEMKRVMAEQMADVDEAIRVFEGPGGSTLIGVRNQRAIDVLQNEIANGKRHVAIFYGGAHMPDMATRLMAALPLERRETTWLTAWDLKP